MFNEPSVLEIIGVMLIPWTFPLFVWFFSTIENQGNHDPFLGG